MYKTFFFLQHISTLQHVLLSLHGVRLNDNQFLSIHVFSNMSSVIVAKASVILAFKFVRKILTTVL